MDLGIASSGFRAVRQYYALPAELFMVPVILLE